jgi:peptide-methionine (S)-S-oxide reductase
MRHVCILQVIYDPSEVSYEQLLNTFFERVDPTTKNRQGNDVGSQYRSGIYWHTPEQRAAAEKVRDTQRGCACHTCDCCDMYINDKSGA